MDTYALWDLIHDKSHSVGELPFDPFMIRQRAPFWMYGLEELRVDLRAFCEATRLAAAAREHIDGRFTPEALGADLAETYDEMQRDLAARVNPARRRGIGAVPAAVRSLT